MSRRLTFFILLIFSMSVALVCVKTYLGLKALTFSVDDTSLLFVMNKSEQGKINNTFVVNKGWTLLNGSRDNSLQKDVRHSLTYMTNTVSNSVFEINQNLKRLLKPNADYKHQSKCDLSKTEHFIVLPAPWGRLGNMMFQAASTLGIATKIQYRFVLPPDHTILKIFRMSNLVYTASPVNVLDIEEDNWINMIEKNNMEWMCKNISLRGYLQNYNYFSHVRNLVRDMFSFESGVMKTAEDFLVARVSTLATKIGIHVRRGDFLKSEARSYGRTVATISYINKAIDYFLKRFKDVVFVVCSDDLQWCKNNILVPDVIFSDSTDPAIDMAILSLCNHSIITVGTFGWWAGFLTGGTVVYLNDYPIPGSSLDRITPTDIYYPSDWIGMSNA